MVKNNNAGAMPAHIAFIMDGNGRWAKRRGLPRTMGHRAGVEALIKIVEHCGELGIKYLSVYAFSTENWSRPKKEIDALMQLLVEFMDKNLKRLNEKGVQIRILGELDDRFPAKVTDKIKSALELTAGNQNMILNIALNYGGRSEIVRAARMLAQEAAEGKLDPQEITEEVFGKYLYTRECPSPDLLIRTSGEQRISNFLLYQCAYAEMYFPETFFPDFDEKKLDKALEVFRSRDRRYGNITDDEE